MVSENLFVRKFGVRKFASENLLSEKLWEKSPRPTFIFIVYIAAQENYVFYKKCSNIVYISIIQLSIDNGRYILR